MSKVISISFLINLLFIALIFIRDSIFVLNDKSYFIFKDFIEFLDSIIYIKEWTAYSFINFNQEILIEILVNYSLTYILLIGFSVWLIRELIFGKFIEKRKFLTKYGTIIGKDLLYLESFNVHIKIKNINEEKYKYSKINFGEYKGTKWKELTEVQALNLLKTEYDKKRMKLIENALFFLEKKKIDSKLY